MRVLNNLQAAPARLIHSLLGAMDLYWQPFVSKIGTEEVVNLSIVMGHKSRAHQFGLIDVL